MTRREVLRRSVLAGGAILAAPMINRGRARVFAHSRIEYSTRAVDLVRRSLVIDMLSLLTMDWQRLTDWQTRPEAFTKDDLDKIRMSGVKVFHPAVELNADDPREATRKWFGDWGRFIANHDDVFLRVDKAIHFEPSESAGRIGILLGHQNSDHIRSEGDVELFHGLGQRVSQLTYNTQNDLGCGCMEQVDRGLSAFGATIIAAMNRVGIAVDVSHCGERTTLDAFEASRKPVLITHSNCRALVPRHPRCKSDQVLRRMGKDGSVIGITAIRPFVKPHDPTTVEDVLKHFDHVIRVAGIEHVGIGSDRDLDDRQRDRIPTSMDIQGLNHPQRVYDIVDGLVRRRYSDRAIELILGGNFRRVLSEIWAA